MKTVTYTEWKNGARCFSNKGKQMDILEEIGRQEFIKKFPEISTYGTDMFDTFLEDGTILWYSDWNGEMYLFNGKMYKPFYKECEEGDFDIIGYYEA